MIAAMLAACGSPEEVELKHDTCEFQQNACDEGTRVKRVPELTCLEGGDGLRIRVEVDGWTGGDSAVHLWLPPEPTDAARYHETHELCTVAVLGGELGPKGRTTPWREVLEVELLTGSPPAPECEPDQCPFFDLDGNPLRDEHGEPLDPPPETAFTCDDVDELTVAVVVTDSNGDRGRSGDCFATGPEAALAEPLATRWGCPERCDWRTP